MEFAAISFVFSLAIQLQVCLVALERVAFQGKMRKQKVGSVVERRRKATLPAV